MSDTSGSPGDLMVLRTADGSHTLWSETLQENYHSVNGAVDEARHVYIAMGFTAMPGDSISILEVGLGSGLDLLLTAVEAERTGRMVLYTALEPYPLPLDMHVQLDHAAVIARPDLAGDLFAAVTMHSGGSAKVGGNVSFTLWNVPVQEFTTAERFDLIYFDAFAPSVQPEMWTEENFRKMFDMLRPGGRMVTYCAKGYVRRSLETVGFVVERLKGPPGKQHMLRATRPLAP